MDMLSDIARTVLYEGYILWPYRRTATKNQQRWTFGGVYPPGYQLAQEGSDRAALQTECLVETRPGARVEVRVRWLHVVARQVMRDVNGALEPVDALTVGGTRYLTWEEAVEREVVAPALVLEADAVTSVRSCALPVAIPAGSDTEPLLGEHGARAGAVVRSWGALDAMLTISAERLDTERLDAGQVDAEALYRVRATMTNTSAWAGSARPEALRHTLVSTHAILHVTNGAFVSLMDPGVHSEAAAACRNEGMWPVLAGEEGTHDTMLSSPIILYDYPRVAPESPGDLFDGGEIDQLLILNVLTLSDEEKREMRDTDPRAREILDRCASLSRDDMMRLHGTVRSLVPNRER